MTFLAAVRMSTVPTAAVTTRNGLPPVLSIYIDLVRVGAAAVVILQHAWPVLFPANPLPWPGHDAVVVFFLLSGLVIAHATNRPGLDLAEYAVHRAARIWSVTVPALVLCAVVSAWLDGAGLGEVAPASPGAAAAAGGLLLSLVSAGQIWFLDRAPTLDAPFWSLNFEVWYYALFGVLWFCRGRTRLLAATAMAAVAGPKILLLMPIWLLGVALYWWRPPMRARTALGFWIVSALLALIYIQLDLSVVIRTHMVARWPGVMGLLGGANQFAGDWILACIVALNFTATASLGRFGRPLFICARVIRATAGCSFSAYLYHAPLLAACVLGLHMRGWQALVAVVAGIAVLAPFTEQQAGRLRGVLRRLLASVRLDHAQDRGKRASLG